MTHSRRLLPVSLLACSALAAGCGARAQVTGEEVEALEERIAELERESGRDSVRVEDLEERLYLLQDRLEATRIALDRRDNEEWGRVREEYADTGTRRSNWSDMPNTSPPPPFPEVDPLSRSGVPDLPVTQVRPTDATPPDYEDEYTDPWAPVPDDGEEIVITMEDFERFVRESDGDGGSSGGSRGDPPRRPQPPVVTNGDRLPVMQVDSDNRVVSSQETSSSGGSSSLDLYRSSLDLFNAGNYANAIESMNAYLATGPETDYMDNALFWLGECYYGLGQYDQALGYFQRVVSEYPDGNKVADSLLKVALSYERLSDLDRARDVLNVLVQTYPTTDAARRATERLREIQ